MVVCSQEAHTSRCHMHKAAASPEGEKPACIAAAWTHSMRQKCVTVLQPQPGELQLAGCRPLSTLLLSQGASSPRHAAAHMPAGRWQGGTCEGVEYAETL